MSIKTTIKSFGLSSILASIIVSTPLMAGTYEAAVKQAKAEIAEAKKLNYEWRDSGKMLDKAAKLEKAGKHKEAMKLVAAAAQQGKLAVAQAKQQASVSGPH